jgi:hypothetical protein
MIAPAGLLLALAAAQAAQAAPAPEPVPPIQAPPVSGPVLKAGTPVFTRTLDALSSRTARQGDRFRIIVLRDVLVDGLVVIPAGAQGYGEVHRVIEKGMMGKSGRLEIVPLFVEIGGARIALDGASRDKGDSNLAPVLLAWPLAGPAMAFVSGTHAIVPAGTDLEARVHADLPLRPAD